MSLLKLSEIGFSQKKNEHVSDVFKYIKWSSLSIDVFLDFILNESKLILTYQELQTDIINEFQRRCKDDIINCNNLDNDDLPFVNKQSQIKKSSDNTYNINSSQNITEVIKKSFISDFIMKLVSK